MKLRRIILPVLKNIEGTDITNENDDLKSIIAKLEEEYNEFIEAVTENHDMDHILEEYFDLIQTCIRAGKVLEKMNISLEEASKKHLLKLKKRNWNFSNLINIFYEVK